MPKIIAVANGKGGVGRTTVSLLLGSALAKNNHSVLLVNGGSSHFNHYIQQKDIHPNLTIHDHELYSASELKRLRNLKFDFILIDAPPGYHSSAKDVFSASDEALVVIEPKIPSMHEAKKTVSFAESAGATVVGLIINRIPNTRSSTWEKSVEHAYSKPILGKIPFDKTFDQSGKLDLNDNSQLSRSAKIVGDTLSWMNTPSRSSHAKN